MNTEDNFIDKVINLILSNVNSKSHYLCFENIKCVCNASLCFECKIAHKSNCSRYNKYKKNKNKNININQSYYISYKHQIRELRCTKITQTNLCINTTNDSL